MARNQSTKSTKKSDKLREIYEYTKFTTNYMFQNALVDTIRVYILPLMHLFILSGFIMIITRLPMSKSLNYKNLYDKSRELNLFKFRFFLFFLSCEIEKLCFSIIFSLSGKKCILLQSLAK